MRGLGVHLRCLLCIKDNMPSCMRAPPEAEKMMSGSLFSIEYSIKRVTFSPTALPIDPIMKVLSKTPIAHDMDSIKALPHMKASFCWVSFFEPWSFVS